MKNIILVTIDSLRADRCGFMDHGKQTTPALDKIANDGLVFENVISPGNSTSESLAVIWSGTHFDSLFDVEESWREHWQKQISRHLERNKTIPERFSEKGYTTAGFSSNIWTKIEEFRQGFDEFQNYQVDRGGKALDFLSSLPIVGEAASAINHPSLTRWESMIDDIVEWMNSTDSPFFVWAFLMDVHYPYHPPLRYNQFNTPLERFYANAQFRRSRWGRDGLSERDESRLRRTYDAAIIYTDDFFAQLSHAMDDDDICVVHSDYGEALGEHGNYYHRAHLYQENIHTPLVISNANITGRIDTPVSSKDLPHLLEKIANFDEYHKSEDLIQDVRSATSISYQGGRAAGQSGKWKVILSKSQQELYNLDDDPDERKNLIDDHKLESVLNDEVLQCLNDLTPNKVPVQPSKKP